MQRLLHVKNFFITEKRARFSPNLELTISLETAREGAGAGAASIDGVPDVLAGIRFNFRDPIGPGAFIVAASAALEKVSGSDTGSADTLVDTVGVILEEMEDCGRNLGSTRFGNILT